jgi:hypothetical protein
VAAAFKHGIQVRIANSFHVNALPHARSPCAAAIVRRFIATLAPGDTSCAPEVPPLRLVAKFVRHAAELEPVAEAAGNRADPAERRWVAAAVAAVGDVLARPGGEHPGVGLRGGTFKASRHGTATHFELEQVKWTEDLAVSGTIDRAAHDTGPVRATLRLHTAAGASGQITIEWNEADPAPLARIRGSFAGAAVDGRAPAP